MEPVELFFSYSHRDEKLRDKLEPHLAMLKRDQIIKSWHDRKISAGTEWAQAIDDHLNSAGIILLLISADFLASDYCYDLEMGRAMERHEAGDARVIPIILKPVDWSGAKFGKLQAFPTNAKAVTLWANRDQAFTNIAQGIRQAAMEMAAVLQQRSAAEARSAVPPTAGVSAVVVDPPDALVALSPVGLEEVGGQVPLESVFYVNRPPVEERCFAAIAKPGALIRIKAPRQMGKSSLMLRMMQFARDRGEQAAVLNFQYAEQDCLSNLDLFLQWFCLTLTDQLGLEERLADYWKGSLGCKNKCTNYLQRYLLPEIKTAIALCLDEVDEIFQHPAIATDFFGMLRAWHEESKVKPIWRNLRLVIVHSKEVYIPLNINQSPFNVGLPIDLPPLTADQVRDLAQRHGLAWAEPEVVELMNMVGGHPFLVRGALQAIARGELTLAQVLHVAPTEGGLFGEHLRRHLLNLEGDAKLLAAMKVVLATDQPILIDTTEAFKLVSMGVVRYEGSRVVPLCDVYRQYFGDRLGVKP
jgi:AAA-like domain/TIR domain